MKNALIAAAIAAPTLWAASSASAAPYTLYEFRTLSWECTIQSPMGCGGSYGPEAIDGFRVGLSSVTANLAVSGSQDETYEYSNSNIEYVGMSYPGMNINLREGSCLSGMICYAYFNFVVDSLLGLLQGSFYLNDSSDMFVMSSNGSTLWTGYYKSDNGHNDQLYYLFSGMWYETPEPSPIALIGAGLAGLIWVRRRRDTREQAQQSAVRLD